MNNQQNNQQIDILIFRYIDKETTPKFISQMNDWNIPLIVAVSPNQPMPSISPGQPSPPVSVKAEPSAPLDLWSYPDFADPSSIDPAQITYRVASSDRHLHLSVTELNSLKIVYVWRGLELQDLPPHFPFRYILSFHFVVKPPYRLSAQTSLLEQLDQATDEVKKFTDVVSVGAQYRPVYWFLAGIPGELHGLKRVLNKVKSPSGKEIDVERGFPDASYIIYDTSPQQEDMKITDLGLLSVVTHKIERGYRADMAELTKKIRPDPSQLATLQNSSMAELQSQIRVLSGLQDNLHDRTNEYYGLRRSIIRTKGLVGRIREKCGGLGSKNLFDIICDDALTVIGEEAEVSQGEIETSLKEQNDWLDNVYKRKNDLRSQNLQRIGNLLQSTAIAFIAFQISDKLLEIFQMNSLTRLIIDLVITILAGVLMYLLLLKIE